MLITSLSYRVRYIVEKMPLELGCPRKPQQFIYPVLFYGYLVVLFTGWGRVEERDLKGGYFCSFKLVTMEYLQVTNGYKRERVEDQPHGSLVIESVNVSTSSDAEKYSFKTSLHEQAIEFDAMNREANQAHGNLVVEPHHVPTPSHAEKEISKSSTHEKKSINDAL
ncbi:hypothetical protein Cni_G06390 [Canna indica]|uniref:Uncharacterized protein n=1 Tax=Canna indica TaxID=4628 RepID=A0AAQ3JZA3_9LILI|nr:hypothetical protein Cni_G06390 [Canna indica]